MSEDATSMLMFVIRDSHRIRYNSSEVGGKVLGLEEIAGVIF